MVGCAASPTRTVYVGVTLTRSRAFELPTISEVVHADGDDHRPLAGLSGCVYFVL